MVISDAARALEGAGAYAGRLDRSVAPAVDGATATAVAAETTTHRPAVLTKAHPAGSALDAAADGAAQLGDAVPRAETALRAARAGVDGLGERLVRLDALTRETYWVAGGDERRTQAVAELQAVRTGLAGALAKDVAPVLPEVVVDDLQHLRSTLAMVDTSHDMESPMGGWKGARTLADRVAGELEGLTAERVAGGATDAALNPHATAVDAAVRAGATLGATGPAATAAGVAGFARQLADVNAVLDRQLTRLSQLPATRDREAVQAGRLHDVVVAGVERLRPVRDGGQLGPVLTASMSRLLDGSELATFTDARGTAHRLATYRGQAVTGQLRQLADLADALPTGAGTGTAKLVAARDALAPALTGRPAPIDRATAAERLRQTADLLSATAVAWNEVPAAAGGVDRAGIGMGTQFALRRAGSADAATVVRQAGAARPPLPGAMRSSARMLARAIDAGATASGDDRAHGLRTRASELRALASDLERLPEPPPASSAAVEATRAEIADVLDAFDDMRDVSTDYQRIAEALPKWQALLTRIDSIAGSLPPELPAVVRDPLLDRVDRLSDQVARAQRSLDGGGGTLDEKLFPKQALLGAIEADLRLLDDVLPELTATPAAI